MARGVNGLFYFVSGAQQMQAEGLGSVALHLEGCGCKSRGVVNGPGGQHGVVFWPYARGSAAGAAEGAVNVGYFPARQVWRNVGAYWVGWMVDGVPGPEDLDRGEARGVWRVKLADGNWWTFTPPGALPKRFGYDGEGKFAEVEHPGWGRHYAAARALFDWACSGQGMQYEALVEHLGVCLSVNYLVGHREALALELFDSELVEVAARAAVGVESLVEAAKKKQLSGGPG